MKGIINVIIFISGFSESRGGRIVFTNTLKKIYGADFFDFFFRLVRFKISDRKIETVITNLDRENFASEELKKLYNMCWVIETSFRGLKTYDRNIR